VARARGCRAADSHGAQTVSLYLPLNIRLLTTLRPAFVRIRDLKPCTRARRLFRG